MTQRKHSAEVIEARNRAASGYLKTIYRTSVAVRKELEPGLKEVVEIAGANSLSDLLTCIATYPEEAGELLAPFVKKASVKYVKRPYRKHKIGTATVTKEIQQMMDGKEMTPEEFEELRKVIASRVGKED